MRLLSSLLPIFILISSPGFSMSKIECTHFVYDGVPFVTVTLTAKPDGHIERLAQLTHYGQTRQTAAEEQSTNNGELFNLVIEADSPGNELRLVIARETNSAGDYLARLINERDPVMKEMKGTCHVTN